MKPGTGLSSIFRPSLPITLLVLAEVLGKHGPGPVFLRHGKRGTAERMVFGKAACGRGAFPENRGGILGDLDEFGRDPPAPALLQNLAPGLIVADPAGIRVVGKLEG